MTLDHSLPLQTEAHLAGRNTGSTPDAPANRGGEVDSGAASGATERRKRRSNDPLVALHYQLSSTRARGELDAIVVADSSGVVVAGAGSWPVCEELAAYAPLLADGSWASMTSQVSSRVETLRPDVEVRWLSVAGQDVLLCARRTRSGSVVLQNVERDVAHAAAGVSRILQTAA